MRHATAVSNVGGVTNGRGRGVVVNEPRQYQDNGLADYIVPAKYARFRSDLGRWETFAQMIDRVEAMHGAFFGRRLDRKLGGHVADPPTHPADYALLVDELVHRSLSEVTTRAFQAVRAKRVLPSMRSLQFGGSEILGTADVARWNALRPNAVNYARASGTRPAHISSAHGGCGETACED